MAMEHIYRAGRSQRTLLVCHGTGGDENSLLWLADALDPEANVLSPRGQVMERGMPRFFRRFAEGVFDLEDVRARCKEMSVFVTWAAREYGFSADQVVGVGYSNGANILLQTLLLHPQSLAAVAAFRAMVVLEDVGTPNLEGTPVFLSEGLHDPIVPVENAERLAAQLQGFGANVSLNWDEGGHDLARGEIIAAQLWLAQ